MDSLESWKYTMRLFCSANSFDPRRLKQGVKRAPARASEFRARFDWVLSERPFTWSQWEKEFDTSFYDDEDDELYKHLQSIYDYLFLGGPMP